MTDRLSDAAHDAALGRDGFVVVPLISPSEVQLLRRRVTSLLPPPGFGSHYTSASSDVDHRQAVFEVIREAFAPAVQRTLASFRPVTANLFVKEPGPSTSLVVHQDWMFVDERRTRSLNIWCPLEDADERNGTLRVLPGSHLRFDNLRGTALGQGGLPSPFAGCEEFVTEGYLEPVRVAAGSAIINNHRLVHSSGDNRSDTLRIAASLTLVPEGEVVTHAFGRGDGIVDLIEMDDTQLRSHQIGTRPSGSVVRSFSYDRPPLGESGLIEMLGPPRRQSVAEPEPVTRRRTLAGIVRHVPRRPRRTGNGSDHQSAQNPR